MLSVYVVGEKGCSKTAVTLINVLWTLILLSNIISSVVLMAVILRGACGAGSFDLSPFSEPGKIG